MRIVCVLMGPKHCGKTAVGLELAGLLGACFFDIDQEITKRQGRSPRELYAVSPETFRRAEAGALEEVLGAIDALPAGQSAVIAAGGGIIDNADAVALLDQRRAGACFRRVFLSISADAAWARVLKTAEYTGELPPFLRTAAPQKTHYALHTRRNPLYAAFCDAVVSVDGKTPHAICTEIAALLEQSTPDAE